MKRIGLLICLFLPAIAYAGVFDVPSTDKSMQYLGMVFGQVAGLPIRSQGNALYSQLLYLFNQVVLALGLVIVIYTAVVGTIHTAQEGKFLGEKWHSILVPFRAAVGLYVMLPSSTGYNWIQVGVMWFIIQGVGAANALWTQVIVSNSQQGNLNQNQGTMQLYQSAEQTVNGLFTCELCMMAINNNAQAVQILGENIQAFRFGDQIAFGRLSKAGTETPLCGYVDLATAENSIAPQNASQQQLEQGKSSIASAIFLAQAALQPSATEALQDPPGAWTYQYSFATCANTLRSLVQQLTFKFSNLNSVLKQAITDGWITAGAYFYQLVQQGNYQATQVNIPVMGIDSGNLDTLLGTAISGPILTQVSNAQNTYIASVNALFGSNQNGSSASPVKITSSLNSPGSQIAQAIIGIFASFMGIIGQQASDYFAGQRNQVADPLVSMAQFGQSILSALEASFWVMLSAVIILWGAISWYQEFNPAPQTANGIALVIYAIVQLMIATLWVTGVLLGIYAPLIPYLVFTFTAFGWIILVIEGMLGAPLIALSLVVPSEDEIGKAGHALVILVSLFLRPSLMILGFVMAIKLLMVVVDMLNIGFFATLQIMSSSLATVFATITVITLYTSLCLSVINEAFSLIYVLPQKILAWIGGGREGEEAGGFVKEIKGSAEQAGETTSGIMKGGLAGGKEGAEGAAKDKKDAKKPK